MPEIRVHENEGEPGAVGSMDPLLEELQADQRAVLALLHAIDLNNAEIWGEMDKARPDERLIRDRSARINKCVNGVLNIFGEKSKLR